MWPFAKYCKRHAISVAKGNVQDFDRRPSVAGGDAFDPKRMLLNRDVGTFDPVAFGAFLATQGVGAALG